jgi:hypothetical protein
MKADMEQNAQITLVEIRERLVRIETILEEQDYKALQKTAEEAYSMAQKNEKNVSELQSYVKWFVMAVLGAFIAAICALVFK